MPQIHRPNSLGQPSTALGVARQREAVAQQNERRANTVRERESSREMPGWRRIEALRERRALKEALTDIWSDDPELDEDIFFPDDDTDSAYYRHLNGSEDDDEDTVTLDPDDDLVDE